jgi:hypothetical protein
VNTHSPNRSRIPDELQLHLASAMTPASQQPRRSARLGRGCVCAGRTRGGRRGLRGWLVVVERSRRRRIAGQQRRQCLTSKRLEGGRNGKAAGPDGRRKFGSVSSASAAVLATVEGEMKVQDIRAAVEESVGGSVSRFSVSDFLLTRSKGSKPLFERRRHGHYRRLP